MLQLHKDMITYNTLGVGKRIISICDGDVQEEVCKKNEFTNLPKCFLPVPSIEKYLKKKLIDEPDRCFIKYLGDQYFTQRSIRDILLDYKNDPKTIKKGDKSGKGLYDVLCSNLKKNGIEEERFVQYLCDDIFHFEDMSGFKQSLTSML